MHTSTHITIRGTVIVKFPGTTMIIDLSCTRTDGPSTMITTCVNTVIVVVDFFLNMTTTISKWIICTMTMLGIMDSPELSRKEIISESLTGKEFLDWIADMERYFEYLNMMEK